MTLHIPFDNSYARLPDRFFTRLDPTPVSAPALIRVNKDLAHELGIDPDTLTTPEGLAVLSGNDTADGAEPLAQAYAGHQFGGWSPQLGDGRAHLLGEIVDRGGHRRDIQLKGSGPTPYSRMGDGRAWLGPVMREYIVSEAMHALGVPTTRALAAVTTGDVVLREAPMPGAVLTRVAASHIRVGTFQYFAARQDAEALKLLTAHAIARHYPEAANAEIPALTFFEGVVTAQAHLAARWMSLGFIHGVMNTDNTQIAGETIDYGPCAFMDVYHPATVFSSIDQHGRYAFNKQPDILLWNLAQLGSCLLGQIDPVTDRAVELATAVLDTYPDTFRAEWLRLHRAKLGLETPQAGDAELIHTLLDRMAVGKADFTNTFRGLGDGTANAAFEDQSAYDSWEPLWHDRLAIEGATPGARSEALNAANPALIPRNHRVEEAILAGLSGNYRPFERLLGALATPHGLRAGDTDLAQPPQPEEKVHQTFCGT